MKQHLKFKSCHWAALLCFLMISCLTNSLLAATAVAQEQIKGRVIDAEAQKPMPGVTVSVSGTTVRTQTNANGRAQVP